MSHKLCKGAFWEVGPPATAGGYVAVCSLCKRDAGSHPPSAPWKPFDAWLREKIEHHRPLFSARDEALARAALAAIEAAGQTEP